MAAKTWEPKILERIAEILFISSMGGETELPSRK